MAVPTVVSVSALASGTGNVTPTIGTHAANDVMAVFVETSNEAVAAPTGGWTAIPGSPSSNGSNTRVTGFWKLAAGSSETNPAVLDPGDHAHAFVIVFRGTDLTTPFRAAATSYTTSTVTTMVASPGIYNPAVDALWVLVAARHNDLAGAHWSGETLADVASLTEQFDDGSLDGNGGGLGCWTGSKVAVGNIAQLAATLSTGGAQAYIALIIQPPQATGSTGNSLITSGVF